MLPYQDLNISGFLAVDVEYARNLLNNKNKKFTKFAEKLYSNQMPDEISRLCTRIQNGIPLRLELTFSFNYFENISESAFLISILKVQKIQYDIIFHLIFINMIFIYSDVLFWSFKFSLQFFL
jgi:hypothetical protein